MKNIAINIAKVVVVVLLVAYVLSNIQWRDTLAYIDPASGEVTRLLVGDIIGDWDQPVVEFRPTNAVDTLLIDRDMESERVSPGLFTYFKNLDLYYFLIGTLLIIATIMFSAVRWWWLLGANRLNVSLFDSIRYTWLGFFFNNVLPGQTGGDVVKALYIARRCSGDKVPAFLSVFVDRALGLTSLAVLGAVVVLFYIDRFTEIAVAIWSFLALGVVLACAIFSRRLRERLRLGHLLAKLPAKVKNLLLEVDSAIYHYRSHKAGVAVWLVLGMVNHAVSVSGVVMFGQSIGVGIPVHEYFVLVPVITIISSIPIAPAGWGIGEALFAKLFGEYGAVYLAGTPNAELVMSTRGIALSILFRVMMTAFSLLGGLVLLFEKQRLNKQEIQEQARL